MDKEIIGNRKHCTGSPKLRKQINSSKVVHTFLTKRTESNKLIKRIERKISKGTHLPIKVKDLQTGY